ncbi:MAG: folate-sensitive fragile site protein Fra10Ac1-domain-containing protein [Monoraphidium minutum]|nr:MAG: folate-sensitive fragile site protein Fra10Ac1-domain-containing protein [Monoraphidium minutum]
MAGFGQARRDAYDRSARVDYFRATFAGLTAFERHQRLLGQLAAYGGGGSGDAGDPTAALAATKTDADVLRESYRFIRRPEDDAADTWENRLARRYYSRLFREYAIADLSRYQEQKVGLRWRTEAEVAAGRGQFTCGARGCGAREGLASFELMFKYVEGGEERAALVKVKGKCETARAH